MNKLENMIMECELDLDKKMADRLLYEISYWHCEASDSIANAENADELYYELRRTIREFTPIYKETH